MLRKKEVFYSIVLLINTTEILFSLFLEVNPFFACAFLLWSNTLLYAMADLKKRVTLFSFLSTFFIFLIGRPFVEQFFHYETEFFVDDVETHAYTSIFISLLCIIIGYALFKQNQAFPRKELIPHTNQFNSIKRTSLFLFYITWCSAIASKILIIRYVSDTSYLDYYTEYSNYLFENIWLYVLSKIEAIMPVAFCIFMATLPSKKEFKLPLVFYLIYLVLSLGTGMRGGFMLGLFLLFIYYLLRSRITPEEKWFTKRHVALIICLIPMFIILFVMMAYIRTGNSYESLSIGDAIFSFLYSQGVSINIIKRAYMYHEQIAPQLYTLEFLHSGILAKLLGIPVIYGNNVDHALYGGSFTHSLAYIVLGDAYLSGQGTGSSFIAELNYDWGYAGILLGSLLYAFIIAKLDTLKSHYHVYEMSLKLCIIAPLLWSPRGSFSSILMYLLSPTTIIAFIFVFIGASFLNHLRHYDRKIPK